MRWRNDVVGYLRGFVVGRRVLFTVKSFCKTAEEGEAVCMGESVWSLSSLE